MELIRVKQDSYASNKWRQHEVTKHYIYKIQQIYNKCLIENEEIATSYNFATGYKENFANQIIKNISCNDNEPSIECMLFQHNGGPSFKTCNPRN